ncbi:MAG: DUF4238 domain-containing protein [Candidatus Poribacteria bacterium]|nr:DUF4238 domain-containing protein [Candidatus Poribacteria bacterium]
MARHHYVSKFYYKNFVYSTEDPLVYIMKEGKISNRRRSSSQIGYEEDYNTPDQEQTQSQLETRYAKILRELIEAVDHGEYNASIVDKFIKFVSFMLGNNIFVRENLIPKVYTINKIKQNGVDVDTKIEEDSGYSGKFDWSINFSSCFYREFQNWMWEFIRLDPSCRGHFITSDNPVSIFNPENVFTPLDVKLKYDESKTEVAGPNISNGRMNIIVTVPLVNISFRQDVVMAFPVTPRLCLIGFSCPERRNKFKRQSKNMFIEFINVMTLYQCNKAVYSHSKELLFHTKVGLLDFQNYCAENNLVPSFEVGIQ